MLNDMPTGKYVQCFRPVLKGFFGFINAKIIAPDGLNKPFLSTTVGGKLVTPLGTWTD